MHVVSHQGHSQASKAWEMIEHIRYTEQHHCRTLCSRIHQFIHSVIEDTSYLRKNNSTIVLSLSQLGFSK